MAAGKAPDRWKRNPRGNKHVDTINIGLEDFLQEERKNEHTCGTVRK